VRGQIRDAVRLLIVGGSDAGTMAALRARTIDPRAEVTMIVADRYPNYSVCGLPFYVSREVEDWEALAHRTTEDLVAQGITLLLDHVATQLDPSLKRVRVRDHAGRERTLAYDTAIIASGALPRTSGISGMELAGVFPLHTMDDSFRIHRHLEASDVEQAVIVGAGYIGLEMADAFVHRGLRVALVSRLPAVMPSVDASLGELVRSELERHGVEIVTGVDVGQIVPRNGHLEVRGTSQFAHSADVVLVGSGVEPNTDLARAAGIASGIRGAIRVDRQMRTNAPDVLAAGDCVETWHRVLEKPTYLPLGTTAHKQGRVAGETAVGGRREFEGSVGTQVVKVFDLAVARTGLRDAEARAAGFDPVTVEAAPWHHKAYYPGARRLHVRITGDRRTGRLLGAQIVGHWQAEVAKRIDIVAAALFHGMAVDGLNDLDLSYTPPVGAPWDAVQEAAQAWLAARVEDVRGSASFTTGSPR
jgi:NADPH-dependent 2,4-dienoyl-CoA reductase/sulfur reductase-like enzyme